MNRNWMYGMCVCVLIMSCQKTQRTKEEPQGSEIQKHDSVSTYLAEWRLDSNSCMGLRTKLVEKGFLKWVEIEGLSKEEFLQRFGNPNKHREVNYNEREGKQIELLYYTNAFCQDSIVDVMASLKVTIDVKTNTVVKTMGMAQ